MDFQKKKKGEKTSSDSSNNDVHDVDHVKFPHEPLSSKMKQRKRQWIHDKNIPPNVKKKSNMKSIS